MQAHTTISDESVLAACATGDAAALGMLFDRFRAVVHRFAARHVSDEPSRDDLVQATFLEVTRAARAYRGDSSVTTWILGVAANVARHAHRGELRARVRQARYLERLTASPRLPDDEVDRRKLLVRIRAALEGLPRDQQLAFLMCDLEQLPGAEVARTLGIPEGTLWRRLHTARRALRAALAT